jgi:uncharacterized protein YukE
MSERRALPAHPGPLDGEIRRLTALRDQLCSTADQIDRLWLDSWQGPANEHFLEFRTRLTKRWRHVADLCDEGIRALEDYRDTLVETRHRMASLDAPEPAWRDLDPAAQAIARRLDALNIKLLALRSVFDTPREVPHPPPPARPLPKPAPPPVDVNLGEPGGPTYSQNLAAISIEFLDAEFE